MTSECAVYVVLVLTGSVEGITMQTPILWYIRLLSATTGAASSTN